MSNRKAEVLNKYLYNLSQLGYTREDAKVKMIIKEIEGAMGLLTSENCIPVTTKDPNKALVIVIKDVSGSMGYWENHVTKEYYNLTLQSIKDKYIDIEEVFVGHGTAAHISNQTDIFAKCESGGTIISSGLKEILDILDTYREVIVIQLSDGDNLTSDNQRCISLLNEEILPKVKYFKYVEANQYNRHSTLLHGTNSYKKINTDNFSTHVIKVKDDALKGLRFAEELESL